MFLNIASLILLEDDIFGTWFKFLLFKSGNLLSFIVGFDDPSISFGSVEGTVLNIDFCVLIIHCYITKRMHITS